MFDRMKTTSGVGPVTWVADAESVHRFGPLLGPVARGLIDSRPGLCLLCEETADLADLPESGMTVVRYRPRPFWMPRRYWREGLAEDLRPHHPVLLHALASSVTALAAGLSTELSVPCLAGCYDLPLTGDRASLPGPLAGLIAASLPLQTALKTLTAAPVHLVRPGVASTDQTHCLQRDNRAVTVVICGALSRPGPFRTVLGTLAQVRTEGLDCELFLVGSGPAERKIRKAARALSMTGWLTFAGEQPLRQLAPVLRDTDIYIAPRRHDRVGIRTLMAMAAGAAVLCAEQPASDFVIPGKTATVFTEGEGTDLAAKLRRLIKDPAATQAQARDALEHLREHHSVQKMLTQIADVYAAALSEP